MFNESEISTVITKILNKRKISIYFPYFEKYSHLVDKSHYQVRYLEKLIKKYLPSLLHSYYKQIFTTTDHKNNQILIHDGINKVNVMSYYENLIYDSHKKTGNIRSKHKSFSLLTNDINDLFFSVGKNDLSINFIKEELGIEAYNDIRSHNVAFIFDHKTMIVSLP